MIENFARRNSSFKHRNYELKWFYSSMSRTKQSISSLSIYTKWLLDKLNSRCLEQICTVRDIESWLYIIKKNILGQKPGSYSDFYIMECVIYWHNQQNKNLKNVFLMCQQITQQIDHYNCVRDFLTCKTVDFWISIYKYSLNLLNSLTALFHWQFF